MKITIKHLTFLFILALAGGGLRADSASDQVSQQVLTQLNAIPGATTSGLPLWHVSMAEEALRCGRWFKAHNYDDYNLQAVAKALAHVAAAAAQTDDSRQFGWAGYRHEVAGMIAEELSGDTNSAISHYRNAVRLNPGCMNAPQRLNNLTHGP